MKSEKEFDDFLKNKFSDESAFPFEEDKWARMEEIIIADETRKRHRKFFFIYLSGFITALVLLVPLVWYVFDSQTLDSKTEDRRQKTGENRETRHKTKDERRELTQNQEIKSTTKEDSLVETNKTTAGNVNSKNTNESTNSGEKQKTEFFASTVTSENKRKVRTAKTKTKIRNQRILTSQQIKKETQKNSEQNTVTEKTETQNKNSEINSKLNEEKNVSEVIKNNAETIKTEKTDSIKKSSEKSDSVSQANTNQNNVLDTTKIYTQIAPLPFDKFSFYLGLGAQYNLGFAKNDGNSFTPTGSFLLQYRFSPTWSFLTGLTYYQVSNLNYEKQITERMYDFGYRDQIFTIQQEKFHYVGVPLEIYRTWKNNNLGLGLNPNFLVANMSKVGQQDVRSLSSSVSESKNSSKYGYGLSALDVQLSFTYFRNFGKKFGAGVSYSYGLIDIRKNSWTGNQNYENNQFIRFNLIYKLK